MADTNTLALSQLHVDKMNVRGASVAPADFVANIGARGVEQKLIVRKNGSGFGVVDGGKRLSALQQLLEAGKIKPDHAVPVDVRKMTDAEAHELSLTLNIVREDMHPVDKYRGLAKLVGDKAIDVEHLTQRFAITRAEAGKILALGSLHDAVLDGWKAGLVDADIAKALTMCPDKKAQLAVFNKVTNKGKQQAAGHYGLSRVKDALKIGHDNPGRAIAIVGADAYEKRGGKVTVDLFGSDHVVSDKRLLAAMVEEKIAERVDQLKAEGWSWVTTERPNNLWAYSNAQPKPADAETESRLKALRKEMNHLEQTLMDPDESPEFEKLSREHDALEDEIRRNAYTDKQKASAGCLVGVNQRGDMIEVRYGLIAPKAEKAVDESAHRSTNAAGKKKKAQRKGDNRISNALVERMSEQMTFAAGAALATQPAQLILAAMLAGFSAHHQQPIVVSQEGLESKRKRRMGYGTPTNSFASTFDELRKKPVADLLTALGKVAGAAVDLWTYNSDKPPMQDKHKAVLLNAIDGKTLNKQLRERFDAADYFNAVSRGVVAAAVTEAMGLDHGRKVAGMKKAEAAKFAIANVPKTGWLPSQLRTKHYDGPQAKAVKAAAKPAKGKAAKGKAKPSAKPAAKAKGKATANKKRKV